jgi:tetratricopeptide (TPR) repeat protein
MKFRILIATALCFMFATPLWAQMSPELRTLSKEWALAKYQTPKAQRKDAFERLAQKASAITSANKGQAEPMIWEAIILASSAGELSGISKLKAVNLVTKARDLLLAAKKINANALDGSVYTSLGSLYYQVPGWPLAFGSDKKARAYLTKALQMNPNGIDQNYFYGDFLLNQKDYAGAIQSFEKALAAAPLRDRPVFDSGRREEIRTALAAARKMQK